MSGSPFYAEKITPPPHVHRPLNNYSSPHARVHHLCIYRKGFVHRHGINRIIEYLILFALGIYLLNIFLAFMAPKIDPFNDLIDTDPDDKDATPSLGQEFKPFIRRLQEFKFWHSATCALVIAILATLTKLFLYFCILFTIMMRRQIQHMIKHKYLQWNYGKQVDYVMY
jgi:predicted PurR-regulated permease PerM